MMDAEHYSDVPLESGGLNKNSICGVVSCRLSEPEIGSEDAKERSASIRKLQIAVVLCIVFMVAEVVGGIKANSLAILTDAAHLLSDVAAYAISLFSIWAAGWEATSRHSYGFYRIEILGALLSIQLIWLLTGILVYEAIMRLIHHTGEVKGVLMFAVSAFGLVVNIGMAVLLGHSHGHGHGHDHGHSHGHGHGHSHSHNQGHDGHSHGHGPSHSHGHSEPELSHSHHSDDHDHGHGHSNDISVTSHHHLSLEVKHNYHHHYQSEEATPTSVDTTAVVHHKKRRNINVHSAYLHVLGDCIQSVGVMIGGAIIWWKPKWKIIDLVCTLIFSLIVLFTTVKMLRKILEVLMESTPREVDATKLEKGLCKIDGVAAVHELHIWALTVGKVLLSCHVTITPEADADLLLNNVIEYTKRKYNISHVTIQVERL